MNIAITAGLVIVIALNVWSDYERRKLNQRQEQMIEQFEEIHEVYRQRVDDFEEFTDEARRQIQEHLDRLE